MSRGWSSGSLRGVGPGGDRWVVKFGGSLLTRPGWPEELLALVSTLPGAITVVVGGGPIVDGLRAVDAARPLPAEITHALAIEAMGITARMVATATGLTIAADPRVEPGSTVLDAPRWLAAPSRAVKLPVGWHVTSDSIAAAVAAELMATLILAKRVPPVSADLDALAEAGWVDAHLPVAAAGLDDILWAAPRPMEPANPYRKP